MGKIISAIAVFAMGAFVASCDLQPKITSLPDTVGDFISARYPAMLADPKTEPEIYNSAVSDYGVYASPELYGSVDMDEYVNYAGIDDYVLKPEPDSVDEVPDDIPDDSVSDDTDDVIVVSEKTDLKNVEQESYDILDVPGYEADELSVPARAAAGTIVVRRGDTLYALAREHNTTIEKLADANSIKPPYTLRIGQVLKLQPDAPKIEPVAKVEPKPITKTEQKPVVKTEQKPAEKPKVETKSEPAKKVAEKKTDVRVPLKTISVAKGDTLYSLSRRYEIPVNDLAVMNGLRPPFALSVGQKLRVPDLPETKVATVKAAQPSKTTTKTTTQKADSKPVTKVTEKKPTKTESKPAQKSPQKTNIKPKETNAPKQTAKPSKENTQTIAARSSSKFSWPVRGTILSHYGAKNGGLYNDGINISAALNTHVNAAENGVVAYAGNEVRGMGNLVIIQHADGWMTVYAHLNSMTVRRGARVSVGQKIGTVGQTGKVTKPQLHFEIRKGTKSYNPVNYLKK